MKKYMWRISKSNSFLSVLIKKGTRRKSRSKNVLLLEYEIFQSSKRIQKVFEARTLFFFAFLFLSIHVQMYEYKKDKYNLKQSE